MKNSRDLNSIFNKKTFLSNLSCKKQKLILKLIYKLKVQMINSSSIKTSSEINGWINNV